MADAFNLPFLPSNAALVDAQGRPTPAFSVWWQQNRDAITKTLNAILAIPEIQQALGSTQAAAAIALAAAATANSAAVAAQGATDANARETSLQNSYIDPDSVLTATPTVITVAAHTRYYGDGSFAAVNAGTVASTGTGDTDYVSYSDPSRTGGSVAFVVSTASPTQTGDTHVVGAVLIPASGSSNGGSGPRKPGYVDAS